MTTRSSVHLTGEAPVSRLPRMVLAATSACTILVMGLVAAINLAVPALAASSLDPTPAQLLWIVDAYVVVFACFVIPAGAAGDRFGRKGVLLTGLAVFALGAAVSALAPGVAVMLVGRTVTGLGAALVLPNCVGVLVHATAPEARRRALAIWGAVSGMGGIAGNTLGAAVLTVATWRWLFVAVVPIAIACLAWVLIATPRSARMRRALDPTGTILFVATIVTLLVGIIEGPQLGWASPTVIAAFTLAILFGLAWVLTELRVREPVLDPRLFRIPALSSAALGLVVTFFGSFGLFYLNASLLQYGRGYSVLRAGLGTLPLALPILLGSRFAPALVARIGIPITLSAAFAAIGGGLFGLSSTTHQPYPAYAGWLIVIGIGFALALPTLTAELTASLPPERAGIAGGLQAAGRELGSALGVAVVGTVLATIFAAHVPSRAAGSGPLTVAQALAAAPGHRDAILQSFAASAATALQFAGTATLVAGAIVILGAVAIPSRRAE